MEVKVHFPPIHRLSFPPLDCSDIFIINQVTVSGWVCFLALHPVSSVNLSVLGLTADCLSYLCFTVRLALWRRSYGSVVLHLLGFLDYSRLSNSVNDV